MKKVEKLKIKIEEKRKELYTTYKRNPKDPQIIVISQELDNLLNHYRENTQRDYPDKSN